MTGARWPRGGGERIKGFSHTKIESAERVALNLMKFTASDAKVFGNVLVCVKGRNKMALF